jgi:hypothetical protein
MPPLSVADKRILSKIVSTYYGGPLKRTITKKRWKQISEKVLVEEPVVKQREIDAGPRSFVYSFIVITNIVSLGILFSLNLVAGIVLLAVSNVAGFVLSRGYRAKKTEEYEEIQTVEKTVEREVEIEPEFVEEVISPQHKIVSIGRGAIRFEAMRLGGHSLIVPPTGLSESPGTAYPLLVDIVQLLKSSSKLERTLDKIPSVLSGDTGTYVVNEETSYGQAITLHGFEKDLQDGFVAIADAYRHIDEVTIDISYSSFSKLTQYLRKRDENVIPPNSDLNSFKSLLVSDGGPKLEDFSRKWTREWSDHLSLLHRVRFESLKDNLATLSHTLSNSINYSAFSFYCPTCNEEIQREILQHDYSVHALTLSGPLSLPRSTRCVYNPDDGLWRCTSCESKTRNPIPISKMLDEILLPAYDKLMEENKIERLKAHREVRGKEMSSRNEMESELEKSFYDYLSEMYSLSDEMDRMKAEIAGEKDAIHSMKRVLRQYDLEQSALMKGILEFSDMKAAEVHERTKKVVQEVDEEKERSQKLLGQTTMEYSRAKRMDDERREIYLRRTLQACQRMALNSDLQTAFQRGLANEMIEAGGQRKEQIALSHQQLEVGREQSRALGADNDILPATAGAQGIEIDIPTPWRLDRRLDIATGKILGKIVGEGHKKPKERVPQNG